VQLEHDASEVMETMGDVCIKAPSGAVLAEAKAFQHNKNMMKRDVTSQELVASVEKGMATEAATPPAADTDSKSEEVTVMLKAKTEELKVKAEEFAKWCKENVHITAPAAVAATALLFLAARR